MSGAETRQRLVEATMETIRSQGIAKVSARTIAATGGVNQALVFYHFGSVSNLLGEACLASTADRVASFSDRLDAVDGFGALVAVARELHAEERAAGNVNVLAQVLAASQSDPELAEITGRALRLWTDRVEQVLARLLAGSPIGELVDARALAHLVSAAFVGLELMGADRHRGRPTCRATPCTGWATAAELLDGLGPIARRTLRATLRRHT